MILCLMNEKCMVNFCTRFQFNFVMIFFVVAPSISFWMIALWPVYTGKNSGRGRLERGSQGSLGSSLVSKQSKNTYSKILMIAGWRISNNKKKVLLTRLWIVWGVCLTRVWHIWRVWLAPGGHDPRACATWADRRRLSRNRAENRPSYNCRLSRCGRWRNYILLIFHNWHCTRKSWSHCLVIRGHTAWNSEYHLKDYTTLQCMMNAKLSKQRFWHCYENGLINNTYHNL